MYRNIGPYIPGSKTSEEGLAHGCEEYWQLIESHFYEILVDPQRKLSWRTCSKGPFSARDLQSRGARLLRSVFRRFDVCILVTQTEPCPRGPSV